MMKIPNLRPHDVNSEHFPSLSKKTWWIGGGIYTWRIFAAPEGEDHVNLSCLAKGADNFSYFTNPTCFHPMDNQVGGMMFTRIFSRHSGGNSI